LKQIISTRSFLRKKKVLKYSPVLKMIWEKKGYDVVAMDITEQFSYSDLIIVCSASSTRHAQTISDALNDEAKKRKEIIRVEGYETGDWILLDTVGVIIHIFTEATRAIYDIEGLWFDVPFFIITEESGK
jgi:ribosome-associated protein